ncbi:MAG: hypothetical protein U0736_10180 [Gemmataceae bacterium]
MRLPAPLLLAFALIAVVGCGPRPPAVVPVEGRVLLDGRPLPHAEVQFLPELRDFGAELNSTGVTDATGRFRLRCLYRSQDGAAVARHRVLVTEAAMPDALRSPAGQGRYAQHLRGLANRPIPPVYGSVAATPLRVDVTPARTEYEIRLTR